MPGPEVLKWLSLKRGCWVPLGTRQSPHVAWLNLCANLMRRHKPSWAVCITGKRRLAKCQEVLSAGGAALANGHSPSALNVEIAADHSAALHRHQVP